MKHVLVAATLIVALSVVTSAEEFRPTFDTVLIPEKLNAQ